MKSINKIFVQYIFLLAIVLCAATFWIISNYNNLSDTYIQTTERHKGELVELSRLLIKEIKVDKNNFSDQKIPSDYSLLEIISEPYYVYNDSILILKDSTYFHYSGENTAILEKLIRLKKSVYSGPDTETYQQVQIFFLITIILFFILFLFLYRNVLRILNKNVNTLFDDIQNDGNGEKLILKELFDIFITLKKYQTMSRQAERQSMVNDIMSQWQMEVKKIVHDLKNPLQRIQMALSEIKEKEKIHLADDAMKEINQNLKSIRSTDLNIEINPDIIEINEFFERINHLFYDINIDLVRTSNTDFKFDEYSFQRICSNLIQNAIEAKAKNISFLFSENDTMIILDIVNDGEEIKNKEKLFIPFATTKKNGSGLGLIIILQLVHMHKGRFFLKSSDQDETVFRLELPK